jgi:hypothetical protein
MVATTNWSHHQKKLENLGGMFRDEFRDEFLPMVVRVVRLGSQRFKDEGTRIGTVRRPPRGVPKAAFASQNWYDV